MRAIRHLAGILVATFGAAFILGVPLAAFDKETDAPWWMFVVFFVFLGALPMWLAIYLLRPSLKTIPAKPCPKCGKTERAEAGLLVRSHNYWMHQLGGWLFAALWGASREQQVRCLSCDTLYFCETRASRIGGIALWVFVLLLLGAHLASQFQESGAAR